MFELLSRRRRVLTRADALNDAHARPAPVGAGIDVEEVTKHYGRRKALDDVSLAVPQGSVLALLGPNGAGKTTLVRVLTTLIRPDRGRALVGGYDVVAEAAMVRRSIGLVGQHAAVDEYLTGRENLTPGPSCSATPPAAPCSVPRRGSPPC